MATRSNLGDPWPQATPQSASSKGKRKWERSVDQPPRKLHRIRQAFPGSVTNNSAFFMTMTLHCPHSGVT